MKSVGVKQLKARLSEYIRLVRTGETVLITDRDEVVAELRPAHRHGAGRAFYRGTAPGPGGGGGTHPPELVEGRLDVEGQGARAATGYSGPVARRGSRRSALTRLPAPCYISTRRRYSGQRSRLERHRRSSDGFGRRGSSCPRVFPSWSRAGRSSACARSVSPGRTDSPMPSATSPPSGPDASCGRLPGASAKWHVQSLMVAGCARWTPSTLPRSSSRDGNSRD